MTEVKVDGFPDRQLQRMKLVIQDLERHGGRREIATVAWCLELGIDAAQFKKVDRPFLMWCGAVRYLRGQTRFGIGQEPGVHILEPGWDWVRFLEQCGNLKQDWLRERREQRAAARADVRDLKAGKVPRSLQSGRDRAREMIAKVPEKPGPIFVDDPLVNREIPNVDDDYLLTWG